MICTECLHMSLNRFLLLAVGLWPYQQSKLVQLQIIIFFGILASFIIFQLTVLVTLKCTPDLFINVLSPALFYAVFAIKYIAFSINIKVVKCLLEQLQHMYNELTDENEISIIEKCGSCAKRYTVILLFASIFGASALTLYLLWPYIFNNQFFTNGTRSRPSLPFITEYFVDQEKYFYLILFHANVAFVIGTFAMLATGTLLIVCQKHACGMFQIASYRITRAMTFETQQKKCLQSDNLICKRIICAVDMHRQAMKFFDSIISRFQIMFFFMIALGVICGSLNFFRVYQVLAYENDIMELSLPAIFIFNHMLYMIMCNYFAQEITDHNSDIFVTVYNIQWYVAPLEIQKMILFLMQMSTKAFNVEIAGLFVASLEGAATLLSTAMSYFTVLYSTSQGHKVH